MPRTVPAAFCSGRLVGERLVEVEVRGLRFYTRVQIWIIIGGWVLRKGGLRIEGGSMLQLWEERQVEGVVRPCSSLHQVRLRRWAVLVQGYLHLTQHAGWQGCTILVNTSPDTCRSILGTRSLRTSCNQWPAKVRVSTRSSGSSRSERCNWGAGPCLGRSRAAPSRSCRGRSSGTLRRGNLRRRGREAVTRWLLSPEIVFTERGFGC